MFVLKRSTLSTHRSTHLGAIAKSRCVLSVFRCPHRVCRGFTIIEVLVTIGLIGVLISLLIPAVMVSLEKARKIGCSNNLRQFGTAMSIVEGQFKAFPPIRQEKFTVNPGSPSTVARGFPLQTSPHVTLLSALELTSIADQIRIDNETFGLGDPMTSEVNAHLLDLRIPVFVCPSTDSLPGSTTYLMSNGTCPSNARIETEEVHTSALRGMFSPGGGRRAAEVVDGLSNTVAFSERITGDGNHSNYTPWRDIAGFELQTQPLPDSMKSRCKSLHTPIVNHLSFCGVGWLFGELGLTCYNHVLAPNSAIPDCSQSGTRFGSPSVVTARSLHDGGVFCLFVDGSVLFINQEIDEIAWRSIGTIDGGETNVSF